jgi:integrase
MGVPLRVGGGISRKANATPQSRIEPACGSEGTAGIHRAIGRDRLTDRAIAAAKARGSIRKLSDGKGLYLAITPEGAKLWRMKYRHGGAERTISFGPHSEIGLAEARKRRDEAREWLRQGKDPVMERRAVKATAGIKQGTTFALVAEEWLARRNYSPAHVIATRRRLDNNLLPDLGTLPVAEIKPVTVLETLRRIERRGALEVAAKCRQLCSQVFRYAVQTGRAETDPAQHLRGALKAPKKESRATIPLKEMPALFKALAKVPAEANTRLALHWLILTACRTGEMRFAEWSEIEHGKLWRIPAERMKMDREHVVSLSKQAQEVLRQAQSLRVSDEARALLFPGFTRHGALSENALLAMLARAGYFGRQTSHGFRASFSTWAHEVAEADPDVIEACLAHVKQGVRGAYNRASYISKRQKLLQAWADQCASWGMRLP